MRITVLAGGVGASRFLRGLVAAAPDAKITVIGNTADDITLFGLRVCPDLDTVMYTLGGGINPEQGWGRADETFSVGEELAAYGAEPSWFTLGDRDFATHILRSQLLASGPAALRRHPASSARAGGRGSSSSRCPTTRSKPTSRSTPLISNGPWFHLRTVRLST